MIESWHSSKQYKKDLILTIKEQILEMKLLGNNNFIGLEIKEKGK